MKNKQGYVYVLSSPNTDLIKIGGSDYPPLKRIKEINNTEPYKRIGPWSLSDFRQVYDWREVEYNIHYIFRDKVDIEIDQQKELFHLSVYEASKKLDEINPDLIIGKPKIDRMFQDDSFLNYITTLFKFTGLLNWIDIQGAWTFVLFPSTSGGRYFTINLGPHEVAFSTLPKNKKKQRNMILVDKLIFDFAKVVKWIKKHNGSIIVNGNVFYYIYKTALPRAVSLIFEGNFEEVIEFYKLDGIRRALIAYWNEALINLKERNTKSLFSRHHNWNAIARINKLLENVGNN
jgi:hypothetical protein